MALSGQLAQGALEDITDSLANIHSASQWLRGCGQHPRSPIPKTFRALFNQIDAEIHRSEKAVKRGLDLALAVGRPECAST
jgi:hypothetical protein